MNTFLVVTHLSHSPSRAPLVIATILAKQLNARILLLYVFPDQLWDIGDEEGADTLKRAEASLSLLAAKYRADNIDVDTLLIEGDPREAIISEAHRTNASMLFIPRRKADIIRDLGIEDITEYIMDKAPCPVFVVPHPTNRSTRIKSLTYATDYTSSDLRVLRELVRIASACKASINVVHISTGELPVEEDLNTLYEFIKKVEKDLGFDRFSVELLSAEDVEQRLIEYTSENDTNLLVLATGHRNAITRLLDPSLTAELARTSAIPVMAFHHNTDEPVKLYGLPV